MRSTSGAQVVKLGECVLKVGEGDVGDRIGREVEWLLHHQGILCLPRVYLHWDRGYIMEPLTKFPWSSSNFDWQLHVQRCLTTLNEQLWCRPDERQVTPAIFLSFIRERCEVAYPTAWGEVLRCAKPLHDWWVHEPHVLTHGDPTFDNQCCRRVGAAVFIDPNPNPRVPPFRAVDLGNLLQSIHGYEHLKYGAPLPLVTPELIRDSLDLTDLEWYAARFFCLTKFVRLLSYETHLRPVFRDVIDRLLEEDDWTL